LLLSAGVFLHKGFIFKKFSAPPELLLLRLPQSETNSIRYLAFLDFNFIYLMRHMFAK